MRMVNILMRASMLPFDNFEIDDILFHDKIWGNSGNLLFVYGLLRNIYKEGIHVDSYQDPEERDAGWINENYDMMLIPLANAFRDNWIGQLEKWAALIRKLKIPAVVTGVGIQADYEPGLTKGFKFDGAARQFAEAVLEKSESIGVRGEITVEYLKRLGIKESRIDVIGCPSMFTFGSFLPRKAPCRLTGQSVLSMNYHGSFQGFFEFLERCKEEYPDYYIVLQGIHDMKLLYAGDKVRKKVHPLYIKDVEYREFRENRLRQFVDVPSWIHFLKRADLSVGSCIHGSIAAVLAGNPTIVFAADARVRELAEYHKIPMIPMKEVNGDTKLARLYEAIDFSRTAEGHKTRYEVFCQFLKKNGVPVAESGGHLNTEFDRKAEETGRKLSGGMESFLAGSREQASENMKKYLLWCGKKIKWHAEQIQNPGGGKSGSGIGEWIGSLQCVLENLDRYGE